MPVMDSKPSRVPEPASRPMQTISPSAPPTSDQLVTLPVKHVSDLLDGQVAHRVLRVDHNGDAVQRHHRGGEAGLGILQVAAGQADVAAAFADCGDAGAGAGGIIGHVDLLVLAHKRLGQRTDDLFHGGGAVGGRRCRTARSRREPGSDALGGGSLGLSGGIAVSAAGRQQGQARAALSIRERVFFSFILDCTPFPILNV